MSEVIEIPDLPTLNSLEEQIDAANKVLTSFSLRLDKVQDIYQQVNAITGAVKQGDISAVTEHFPIDEAISKLSDGARSIKDDVDELDERVESALMIVDEPLTDLKEHVDTVLETIEAIGEWSEVLTEAVDSVLVDKTELIKEGTEALSELRQDKLKEGEEWVAQHIREIIEQLIQEILGDITEKLEQYTQDYREAIVQANDHVETIDQQIENSVGRVSDELKKVTDVLERIKPVLDTAEVILA